MNKRLGMEIRYAWLCDRIALYVDPTHIPQCFDKERCGWNVSDKRKLGTTRREFVEAGWISDQSGTPLDGCMSNVLDTDPAEALDRYVKDNSSYQGSGHHGMVLDFDAERHDHTDRTQIAAWVGRHPEGVTRVDQWGRPDPHGRHFAFPALDAAYARKKKADGIKYAVEHNLAYLLCEMRGFVGPEDKDVFANSKGGGFSSSAFGLDPDKWGEEAVKLAERMRVEIREARRWLAAVEKVIDGIECEGGWKKVVDKYKVDIIAEIVADMEKKAG